MVPTHGCIQEVGTWGNQGGYRAGGHWEATEVAAADAPPVVTLVGRAPGRENEAACGEYELWAVHHGRPAYRQRGGDAVLRYHAPEARWLISAFSAVGNVCSAFAEGAAAPNPGSPELLWHFWESQRNAFLPDPCAKTLAAPALLHIVGRAPRAENARVCGTYRLAGVHDGRPLYVQPGTQKVIRYSAKSDRWLIDCDGLAEPSLASRLYQWIMSGDGSAARDRCSAYADAMGAGHPASCALEWKVWETRHGRHVPDPMLRATAAPLLVRVAGRDPGRENADIVGDYALAGTHCGRPAYVKAGSRAAIRFWPPMSRWVIDREGVRNSEYCVAFADAAPESERPAQIGPWHVFESSRGCHMADPSITVAVPPEAPAMLQAGPVGVVVPLPVDTAGGYKRLLGSPQSSAAKRLRVDEYVPVGRPHGDPRAVGRPLADPRVFGPMGA